MMVALFILLMLAIFLIVHLLTTKHKKAREGRYLFMNTVMEYLIKEVIQYPLIALYPTLPLKITSRKVGVPLQHLKRVEDWED